MNLESLIFFCRDGEAVRSIFDWPEQKVFIRIMRERCGGTNLKNLEDDLVRGDQRQQGMAKGKWMGG